MTLKEVTAVLDCGLNYEVYGSHRNSLILHDSSTRLITESDKKTWIGRLKSVEGKTVVQISRSQNDESTLEIYVDDMEDDDGQA